jgi:hypothetical protein
MERAVSEIFSPADAADTKDYARTHAEIERTRYLPSEVRR